MSADITNWKHKDEWKRYGKGFCVTVTRHGETPYESGCYDSDGGNRWAIYAYIYPEHPHFQKFDGDNLWQEATELGMHSGCSYLHRYYASDGKITSVQVGADYSHLHDWAYSQLATADQAFSIFSDAEDLFSNLSTMTQEIPA